MTREELLQIGKPILLTTEMVKAILGGRKTVTRRLVKYKYDNTEMRMHTDKYGTCLIEIQKDVEGETHGKNPDGSTWHKLLPYIEKNPPFKKGNILYIREKWGISNIDYDDKAVYIVYKTDDESRNCRRVILPNDKFERLYDSMSSSEPDWHPSMHMPKEVARIFLRVKDVRVERLQDITPEQAIKEGIKETFPPLVVDEFRDIWNSANKKTDLALYGWDANPWVWVIEFERIEPESEG